MATWRFAARNGCSSTRRQGTSRWGIGVVTSLLMATAAAGCFDADGGAPSSRSEAGSWDGFQLEPGLVARADANETVLRFDGVLPGPPATPVPLTVGTQLSLPPGPDVVVAIVLTWSEPMVDMDLSTKNAAGTELCRSTRPLPAPDTGHEACRLGPGARSNVTHWDIEVVGYGSASGGSPFTLDVVVSRITRPGIDAAVAARFEAPVFIDKGADTEALLTIGADGTMLACTHGAYREAAPLYASHDNGTTWRRIEVQPNPGASGDCDVAITDDGSWHIVYLSNLVGFSPLTASVAGSDDEGATWRLTTAAGYPTGGAVDRPWLLADGTDVTMTYGNFAARGPALQWFTRSTDGGRSWPVHTVAGAAEGPERIQKLPGHPISWHNGQEIVVPLVTTDDGNMRETDDLRPSRLMLHRSHDGGVLWESSDVAPNEEVNFGFAQIARTSDGTLYVSFAQGPRADHSLKVVWSTDDGASWSDAVTVAEHVSTPQALLGAAIDAHPDGGITLAWLQLAPPDGRAVGNQLWAARVDREAGDPVQWAGAVTPPAGPGFIHEFVTVRHDAAGRAHIVFVTQEAGCALAANDTRQLECLYAIREK